MSVMCAWASQNENGKTTGGTPGDQTGKEVKCGPVYNFGQSAVYRCKDRNKALQIGAAAREIAENDYFGYCQTHRTSAYKALQNADWTVSKVQTPCEIDCSELGACAVNTAYKTTLISPSVYSGNIGTALVNTGFFEKLTASKYLGKSEYLQCGDIIVAPGKHVIVACTDGSDATADTAASNTVTSNTITTNTASTVVNSVTKRNSVIKSGQTHAVQFTGKKIQIDGITGPETNSMKSRVLQHAINKDYNAKIAEDGLFYSASKKALGSHYVKKGETQYMVTAAEILMELNGIDPKGVEYPGIYGSGLTNAAKQKFGGDGQKITASRFLTLI